MALNFYFRSYENHIDGEFILYRNRLYNQEVCFLFILQFQYFAIDRHVLQNDLISSLYKVQTRHKQCHPDYNFPYCTCAVSVQSGQDVFLVDLCGDIQFVDFLSCIDSVIQVYKISDKLYKVRKGLLNSKYIKSLLLYLFLGYQSIFSQIVC